MFGSSAVTFLFEEVDGDCDVIASSGVMSLLRLADCGEVNGEDRFLLGGISALKVLEMLAFDARVV